MIVLKVIEAFTIFLEILLLIYIVVSWLFKKTFMYSKLDELLKPLLVPMRYFMTKSALNAKETDFSPIVLLVLLSGIERMVCEMM